MAKDVLAVAVIRPGSRGSATTRQIRGERSGGGLMRPPGRPSEGAPAE
ncbi:hypothetical protein ACFC08_20795 [Streptomyces sp. NPDC056112]|nr:hypothetical protein [Streptomyces sp. CoT10]